MSYNSRSGASSAGSSRRGYGGPVQPQARGPGSYPGPGGPVSGRRSPPPPANKWAAAAAAAERGASGWDGGDYGGGGGGMAGGYQTQIHDEPEDWNSSEWLSKKTRDVQDESLASSRRALQRMREAEDVAASNITKMYTQSEQLHGIERRLDLAEQHVKVSDAKADELKSLSRFFMIPSFGSKKVRKREGKLDKFQGQLDDTAEARRQEDQARRNRPLEEQSGKSKSKSKKGMPHGAPQPYRNYTTPEGVERDDLEQEIDTNLDEMSSGLARLRMAGLRMNEELDSQKVHLDRIQDKTDYTNERLNQTRGKVTRLLK